MTYIQTASGRKFDILECSADDISIHDIAHSLSQICRFAGHCPKFYSVAQHSCLMSMALPVFTSKRTRLAALLHDASEAYLGDIPKHVKAHIGQPYADLEDRIMRLVAQKFAFDWPLEPVIKSLDGDMLETEFRSIWNGKRFNGMPTYGVALPIGIEPWTSTEAEHRFLSHYCMLEYPSL